MINGVGRAHRRADCAIVGAVALVAVSGVLARELILYTDELQARASLPDRVAVTESPIAVANIEHAAQSECLAEAMYYEARGEGLAGEKAVAEVVLERTRNAKYPKTVCGVVYDGVQPDRRDCQFSFACDGTLRRPRDTTAWTRVQVLAEKILSGSVRLANLTGHAIAYHNIDVAPAWAETMLMTAQIGNHVFYRRDPNAPLRVAQAESSQVLSTLPEHFLAAPVLTVETGLPSFQVKLVRGSEDGA
jgi:hypothetical protein